jgi:ATP-dependent DNA helicase RecG
MKRLDLFQSCIFLAQSKQTDFGILATMKLSLSIPIATLSRINELHADALKRLHIATIRDLLFHFPTRYADSRDVTATTNLEQGKPVTLYGVMEKVAVRRSFKGHIPMTEAYIADQTGVVRAVWFNQAYIGKMYPDGTKVKVSGTVSSDKKGFFLSNPSIERAPDTIPDASDSLFQTNVAPEFLTPVYRETKGITSNYLYILIKKAVQGGALLDISDPIPPHILKKLNLPELKDALLYIHFPKEEKATIAARKRFAFEEIFYMQLKQYKERVLAKHSHAYKITASDVDIRNFMDSFEFVPTKAQEDAVASIMHDMKESFPMGRLLEGDVGSGKTFVAATIAYATLLTSVSKNGLPAASAAQAGQSLQVAYMAPTEILAKQHFESFIKYFEGTGVEIGLLTGSGCKKFPSKSEADGYTDISRSQLVKWLEDGRVSIVIGTHALIQKTVAFANLALVIIDEQHRFGVRQRKALAEKKGEKRKELPHLLSMTATPIPRTLALTMFGDLDLTVIDEMPRDRKRILTETVPARKRKDVYEHIRSELQNGRQVYVICPRIDEQDEEEKQKRMLKSVKEEAKRLGEEIFPEFIVDILHSKMKKEEKEEVMQDFLDKKSHILVATSVVEVGVNVPNATVIVIEHADRFGLAQLHQLRGRVGRSEHQSYCYLCTGSDGEGTQKRLKNLVEAKNGFELAELDMEQRGIGTLMDGKQWGISDLAMEAIKNPKLVEVARTEARELIDNDPDLENYPDLAKIIHVRDSVHME